LRALILLLIAIITINCSSYADFIFKGKIIAYDGLRGEKLIETLEKFLK
jgi:hypothetical protein